MPEKRNVWRALRRGAVIGAALRLDPLRRWWEERKRRAFPEGAVTFHLALGNQERLLQRLDEAVELINRLGLDTLHILHGTAVTCSAGALVVCGPPGIGKSTVLRGLAEQGLLEVREDGMAIVGQRGDSWSYIESGAGPLLDRMSGIALVLRTLFCLRGTSFAMGRTKPSAVRSTLAKLLVDSSAYRLAVLAASFDQRSSFTPREFPLAATAFAEPDMGYVPHATVDSAGQPRSWREVPSWTGVRVMAFPCTGGKRRVMARMRELVVPFCGDGEHGGGS